MLFPECNLLIRAGERDASGWAAFDLNGTRLHLGARIL